MASYHLNPETQKPGRCFAKSPESCKFNNGDTPPQHYSTKEEAQEQSEKALEAEFNQKIQKRSHNTEDNSSKSSQAESVTKPAVKLNHSEKHQNQSTAILETMKKLGEKDRRGQVARMLNDKDFYKGTTAKDWTDRNNGIKYFVYPDRETKTIDRVTLYDNGPCDFSPEELKNIENELNQKLKEN